MSGYVLVVIDVQKGFRDPAWGQRNNPACEANIERLLDSWRRRGLPIVVVQHDSPSPSGLLRRGTEANELEDFVSGRCNLVIRKRSTAPFWASPICTRGCSRRGAAELVICGITTNHCCETTARMGGNLGYDVTFASTPRTPSIAARPTARSSPPTSWRG